MNATYGCDPELFVKDKTGKHVSAFGLVPGTKYEPYPTEFGAVQVDGMALEFNIHPSQGNSPFLTQTLKAIDYLKKVVEQKDLMLSLEPSVIFSDDVFDRAPPQAKELGCEPDFNAWTGDVNPRPNADSTLRTAAGHIHIGWTQVKDPFEETHFQDCCALARQLDYYLGIHSLSWDMDTTRRELYGKAGAFRPKPYGIEYRVLSNQWLQSSGLIVWVQAQASRALRDLMKGISPVSFSHDLARRAINTGNLDILHDSAILSKIGHCPIFQPDIFTDRPKPFVPNKGTNKGRMPKGKMVYHYVSGSHGGSLTSEN